ncbi:hypothetical protein N0V92_001975 [Colletotrichum tropicale]|nr:hypothetical protein N0V92_001975 [Colletotrichum tropicale]
MADKTTPAAASAKEPTAGDTNFMINIFRHMTEKPNIDWEAFAATAGFKSAGVAQTRYGQIRKKYELNSIVGSPVKKRKGNSTDEEESPAKVAKTGGRVGTKGRKGKGKAAVKTEDDDDAEDGLNNKGAVKMEGDDEN